MFENYFFENKNYNDLFPISLGHEDCKKKHSFGPSVRINYIIHYVIRGKGKIFSPYGDFDVKENQIFIIKPGEINTYVADENEPWEYIWVEFNGSVAKKIDEIKMPVMDFNESLFLDMYNVKDNKEFLEEIIISYLFLLIPLICGNNETKNTVSIIKNYIKSNYMKELSIEDISKTIGYSRQHISRVFKSETGISVQQYLINFRINMAKKFLKNGCSVSETTFMCGYKDTFNFSKIFKKYVGVSPKNWQIKNL